MKSVLFHHPLPLIGDASSGSRLRPARMLRAFKNLGYEVVSICGYAAERAASLRRIERDMAAGKRFEFCYSESSTMPYALTEPHHLPLHGELDLDFFRSLKRCGVPLGIYYRDGQWRLPEYLGKGLRRLKGLAARVFYRRELAAIESLADRLYVPSEEFAAWMGFSPEAAVRALPPGGERRPRRDKSDRPYAMLYVGGVAPPIYDLSPFLETARLMPMERFLVVCRAGEWGRLASTGNIPANVHPEHAGADALDSFYDESRFFSLLVSDTEYFSIALPVKLFEAIGREMPVIAIRGGAAARFVEEEGLGWCVDSASEAAALLERLSRGEGREIALVREALSRAAEKNTWESRAAQVAMDLGALREGRG
jgi:glycosyltransferase involved in cell wall biosynthesis